MNNTDSNYLHKKQINKNRKRKWYYTVSLTLAAIVVFSTVYALILPAITLEKETQTLNCPLNVHQHTESCYDSENNLTCGEADYVIHSHEDNCYDEEGNLKCKLSEVLTHKHSTTCYNKKGELICTDAEIEEHTHNDECYDKDGTLICGKLQTIRHVHGSGCFISPESTGEGTTESSASILSETTEATNSSETISSTGPENTISPQSDAGDSARASSQWGYNDDDGSIWWGELSVNQVKKNDIKENTAYIISGVNDNNLMADKTIVAKDDGLTYLEAIPKSQMTDYTVFERWYFEKTDEGKYYVYFLKTNEDGSKNKLYLQFTGEETVGYGENHLLQTALTDDKTNATVFTMSNPTETGHEDQIILSTETNGDTFYLNSFRDDEQAWDNYRNTTHWTAYTGESRGNYLTISKYSPNNIAKRLSTDSSINTVINLFDYWLTPNREDSDKPNTADNSDLLDSKINKDHVFKFTTGDSRGSFPLNYWTQSGELPRQGIVANTLVDRFPVLSGNNDINGTDSTESLKYLFDPNVTHDGKKSFKNVGGLLKLDSEGYYSYDCTKNMAEFDEKSNYIRIYDQPGVTGSGDAGQFFPFNKAPQIMTSGRRDDIINHYFGMTMTTRFIQRYDGYTDEKQGTPTSFHFAGDDDVWVFIDDVLVGDLGGIHDAASLDIDFSTGNVKVKVDNSGKEADLTTIRACYEKAGKANPEQWNEKNTNTFANGTIHTLKFFYLERGNNASNMDLKFNLNEVPMTALEKTDEYKNPIQGAKFAFYAAEGDNKNDPNDTTYHMLDNKDGNRVTLPDNIKYAENGDILDSSGKPIVHALYVGYTDENGKLNLVDADGMPYSIDEIEAKFGNKFILREIEVPETYRMVSNEIHLKVFHAETQKVIVSDNTEDSGTRAETDLRTTATDIIYLRDKNQDPNLEQPAVTAKQFYDPDNKKYNGTIFSVVVKYTGKTEVNDKGERLVPEEDAKKLLTSTKYWTPLYGNDEVGYKLINMTDKDFYTAVIEAAQKKVEFNKEKLETDRTNKKNNYTDEQINDKKYEGVTLQHQANGTMQLYMDDLPGYIRYYYNMLPEDRKDRSRFTVFYFWTDKTLEEATSHNTYLVNTRPIDNDEANISYNGFERVFSAKIDAPNLINDVYVQKVDEKHNLINGATFAMYRVEQQEDGAIHYFDNDGKKRPLPENAKPDENGVITGDGFTISPVELKNGPAVDVTHDFEDKIHTGTVRFRDIPRGQYIIKEIKAPQGYKINTTDIMFLVTDYRAFANAGTKDDGVIVGHGPGYLVSPMHPLAAEDDINNTLTWVYAHMGITGESTSFADAGDTSKIIGYVTKNNSSENLAKDASGAFKTYLMYSKDKTGLAFNYEPDPDRNKSTAASGFRRIFTDSGWSFYQVWQDYKYGLEQTKVHETDKGVPDYYNWSESSITNLFSRSTYIRVFDIENDVTLKPEKVDSSNKDVKLSGAQFRLYRLNSQGEKEYYVKNVNVQQEPTASQEPTVSEEPTVSQEPTVSNEKKYVESVSWSTNAEDAFVVTTGDDGLSTTPTSPDPDDPNKAPTSNFTGLKNGTYHLEEIKAPDGYDLPPKTVELKVIVPDMTTDPSNGCGISSYFDPETNAYTYTITVPNSTGFELPATGGSGTILYTTGGILLILISLVCGYKQKRRRERRFK